MNYSKGREFRVFISSTFRDMHNERDMLNNKVFPEIRKICWERGVNFTPVDLRWGINSEETERGDILRICLDEVEQSRPFFIGLLGQRYGWVPELGQSGLSKQEEEDRYDGIVLQSMLNKRSITEMEILCGVLQAPKNKPIDAFFYFKSDHQTPEDESTEAQSKLADLKSRIRQWTQDNPAKRPLLDGYETLGELFEQIKADLISTIDRNWPINEVPNQVEIERTKHEGYAQSRLQGYVPDVKALDTLNAHLREPINPLFVVTGGAGLGKSSLLANWALELKSNQLNNLVFEHYIGAYGYTSGEKLIHRLLDELALSNTKGITLEEVNQRPTSPQALELCLIEQLNLINKPIVLIIDALNKLDPDDQDLRWLPSKLPKHVKIVLSTVSLEPSKEEGHRVWKALKSELRGLNQSNIMALAPLTDKRLQDVLQDFTTRYRKNFDQDQIKAITSSELAHNPLFLRSVLEEIRIFGRIQASDAIGVKIEISAMLNSYLDITKIEDLFRLILTNREAYFGEKITREILALILVAKEGLSENELFQMLNPERSKINYPMLDILAVIRSFDLHLSHRVYGDGLYQFFHAYIAQAVTEKYKLQAGSQKRIDYHQRLAVYFSNTFVKKRSANELPWQLQQLKAWSQLQDTLTRVDCFSELTEQKPPLELCGYWHAMPEEYKQQLGEKFIAMYYQPKIILGELGSQSKIHMRPEKMPVAYGLRIARFLSWVGEITLSKDIFEHMLANHEELKRQDTKQNQVARNDLASILMQIGDHKAAEKMLKQISQDEMVTIGADHQEALITEHDQAMLQQEIQNYPEAIKLYREVLESQTSLLGDEHEDVLTTAHNLAQTLMEQGENGLDEAEAIYLRNLTKWITLGGESHIATLSTKNNLAGVHMQKKQYDKALSLYQSVLSVRERMLGPAHPETIVCKRNAAYAWQHLGQHQTAVEMLEQVVEASEDSDLAQEPDYLMTLMSLAYSCTKTSEISKEQKALEKALSALDVSPNRDVELQIDIVKMLAENLYQTKQFKAALLHYSNLLEVQQQLLGVKHQLTLITMNDIAGVYQAMGQFGSARSLLQDALMMQTATLGYNNPNTQTTRANLDYLDRMSSRPELAAKVFERIFKIQLRDQGSQSEDLWLTMENLAEAWKQLGELKDASNLYKKLLNIQESILAARHPDILASRKALAQTLEQMEEYDEALQMISANLEDYFTLFEENPNTFALSGIAYFQISAARILRKAEVLEQSKEAIHAANQFLTPLFQKDPESWAPLLIEGLIEFGNILASCDEFEGALKILEQAKNLASEYNQSDLTNLLVEALEKIKSDLN